MSCLSRSGLWVAWFNAWLSGHVGLDDATVEVRGDDVAHDVTGLFAEPASLAEAWVELRRRGAQGASLALPRPGDPLGLGGPPDFNQSALEAEEAVVLDGADVGVVPRVAGRGVFWVLQPATPPRTVPQVSDADRSLREELIAAAQRLGELDVARWRPEVAEALSGLRDARARPLPPHSTDRAQRVAELATRCLTIVDLASGDDGAAVSAYEARSRADALEDLARSARQALVAACSEQPHR